MTSQNSEEKEGERWAHTLECSVGYFVEAAKSRGRFLPVSWSSLTMRRMQPELLFNFDHTVKESSRVYRHPSAECVMSESCAVEPQADG
jgi:hypothetical protein